MVSRRKSGLGKALNNMFGEDKIKQEAMKEVEEDWENNLKNSFKDKTRI